MGKNVLVKCQDGILSTSIGFSSKATTAELLKIVEQAERWTEFFPSLIVGVNPLEKKMEITTRCPLTRIQSTFIGLFEMKSNGDSLYFKGNGYKIFGEDEFTFSVKVLPSTKKDKATTIHLQTESRSVNISFIPLSSMTTILTLLKPIIKSAINQAIKKL